MINSISVKSEEITGKEEVVVLPLFKDTRTLTGAARGLEPFVGDYLKRRRFSGDSGETLLVGIKYRKAPSHVLLLGLGEREKLSPEKTTEDAAAASKALSGRRFKSASLLLGHLATDVQATTFLEAFVKGFALAQYKFSLNQKPPRPSPLKRLNVLAGGDRRSLTGSGRKALVIAEYTAKVRDMVNAPANTLTPTILASQARALCRDHGVDCRVIGTKEMQKEKMGAILSVAKGSREEPKLIVMHYNKPRQDLPTVCFVGKGVTFDSGGISLKPWEHMNEMKGDMAGAAVVIGAVAAAARLELPFQIVGVVPAVENMPGGSAFKPGDVVTAYSGQTIEVLSTDAEGRLILADAITYVRKHYDPVVTVDFATLTGSVLLALGTRIAGVMGNSQSHVDSLVAAGERAGEPVWQLPLDDYFYKSIEGDITDFKNYSGRNGSTIAAAAFLGKFAGERPWIHVDIAGTYWNESGSSYCPKGATGYGLDLTLRFLEKIASA
jgi:leucyl aminopeptidase